MAAALGSIQAALNMPVVRSNLPAQSPKFQQVVEKVKKNDASEAPKQVDWSKLEDALISGKKIPARELLLYQLQVGKLGIRTELLSKVGDSFLSSVRKLQSTGQA